MAKPISTTIRVSDQASAPLLTISKNLGKCISGFMRLNQVSSSAININAFGNCESILQHIDANVDEVTRSLRESASAGDDVERSMNNSQSSAGNLLSTVKRIAGAYLTMQAVGNVVETSDQISSAKQRLSLVLKEGETVDEMNRKIMASANSARASYTDTFNQVAKLGMNAGKSFENTDQIVKFVEQFNKLGALGGASVYESSQAMYQLTQSMAKGKLDGDELRSVMEGMPLVANTIAEYLDTDVGTMKEMAAEGLVTADVVRNALLSAAEDTDAKFQELPYTWAQVFQILKNNATQAFEPVLQKINELANNGKLSSFLNGVMGVVQALGTTIGWILDLVATVFDFCYNNWSWLGPILLIGLGILGSYITAMTIYNGVQAISNGLAAISAAKSALKSGATLAEAAATTTATGAQAGLNAAMWACPIVWIVALVIALIVAIVALCNWIAKTTGVANSGIGIIVGALTVALAFIGNIFVALINMVIDIFVTLWNFIASFVNFFANVFTDPVGSIARLFFDLVDVILSLLQTLAGAIDALFGTKLAEGVQGWRDDLGGWVDKTFGKGEEVMAKVSGESWHVDRFEYGDAWNAGVGIGDGIAETVGGLFDFNAYNDPLNEEGDEIPTYLESIEENTGNTAKSVDISEEDLKYLRDIAEQEAINRFTTAEIKVEMNNNNNINNDMDLDGIVDHLATRVTEAMNVAAAGAY